jgi:hypothetical protein
MLGEDGESGGDEEGEDGKPFPFDRRQGRHWKYEWVPFTGPRGGKGFENTDPPHTKVYGGRPGRRTRSAGMTASDAARHVESVRADPSPEAVAGLAKTLAGMTFAELGKLKKRLGIAAGGETKTAAAEKISKEAARRLTEREHWTREARKAGIRPPSLLAKEAFHTRKEYNAGVKEVESAVARARQLFAHFNGGKKLTRAAKAFVDGDYSTLPQWDVIAEHVAGEFPGLLGKEADWGGEAEDMGYEQKLFDLVGAGKLPRLGYGDSLRQTFERLTGGKPAAADEAAPFAKGKSNGR